MGAERLQRLKNGDPSVLSLYFEQYGKSLLFFANSMVSDEDIAEEVVQDTYIKLWTKRSRIESDSHLKSFIYMTTRNACIDYLRRSDQRMKPIEVEQEDLEEPEGDTLAQIIHVETLYLIYEEVKKLPPMQRQVFRLTYMEDMTTEEICEELHITANAVFIARSKAIGNLRKVFKNKNLFYYLALLQYLYR